MISILFANIFLFLNVAHDYHVCISNIEVNEASSSIQIEQSIFVDDLEKALMLEGIAHRFGDDLNDELSGKYIENYLRKHFEISQGDQIDLVYVGAEWEDYHGINVYWEGKINLEIKELHISNQIFLEVSGDQQNIHHVQWGNRKKSLMLNDSKVSGKIKF